MMGARRWLERRTLIGRSLLEGTLMVGGVLGLLTLILLAAGAPPWAAFQHLVLGSLGSWLKFTRVLMAWIPLTLCACGLVFTFRMGLWNIGVEGQVLAGAILATAVLRAGVTAPSPTLFCWPHLRPACSAAACGRPWPEH